MTPGGGPASPHSGLVTIAGWTNVGKSTLLNRLVGEKLAAVSDVPQTTRQRILGVLTLPGRGQIAFADTPGFHRPLHRMNHGMIETARQALSGADLVLQVLDAEAGLGRGDRELAALLRRMDPPALAVLNKVDRVHPKSKLLPMLQTVVEEWGFPEAFPLSALTGEGVDDLLARVILLLPEGEPLYDEDTLTDQPERALAAEWIREKILHVTRQEIPHAVAVIVDRWTAREDGLVEIDASILVERESQKGIVIGKGGAVLKRVGTEARVDIERLLGARVGLRLRVRVQPGWRDDARALKDLGLT